MEILPVQQSVFVSLHYHRIIEKQENRRAMKNKTEREMILTRRRALARMKRCGISPKKQVLDNETSANYK